ncbi:DNA polymerase III subunit gamma/tau [Acinetobacter sp. NRRL B-65365]|uniref:DNA polymerase III subunit gamma/tau n=1 Tax=Acinetobacter sp. NRRL B-65365 TaxID=1785092 RepID=UPI0007A009B5|nr:DNA polymerase III subunit gamma/tau [Acinetobacter sp. NRRL B-65365]KYQ84114.1 DNA polymerase III subunit gamma/tau [Acinetobacter sp. NRRL B-65365]
MYQVLARKYRPRNFNELVGQNHVSRALTSALERGRLHHAYLFTGTRGVGKTTIARILAKCLNCETGVTSTPCEVCTTCKAVNEGRFIDLIEIDAASRTKVEDTRELLDNVPYAPTQGRFKVYLIDEVHMLSTHSFNALLKTLEEPPEHVKFLFATTDPQKLPITVISRCLQFTLRPLAVDEITEHLSAILNKEHIEADQDAIWQIAESAQGSLRDALSLTDQAIAYGQGAVHHQDVKDMLGLIDRTIIYDLILAIHQNQQARVSQLLLQFRQQALDVSLVLDQLVSTLHELALLQYLPDLALKYSEEINQKILQLSKSISAQDLQLYYQIACKGRAELQLAVTQEQGFEMTVLRLLAFRPMSLNEVTVSATPVTQIAAPAVQQPVQNLNPENQLAVQQEAVSVEPEPEPVAQNSDSNLMVFDAEAGQLIGLETSAQAEIVQSSITDSEDVLIFPVEENTETAPPVDELSLESQPVMATEQAVTVIDEPVAEISVELTANAVASTQEDLSNLMPQDILKLREQSLEGEWNLEKWEYWFRTSQLSPAVQELAQHGIMQGQINGASIFLIPQEYEGMLSQLQHGLEDALKAQWPQTHFNVQYGAVDSNTPLLMQNQRKQKAFNRAVELLHQEPTIKSLVETFDAELHNIQLKP